MRQHSKSAGLIIPAAAAALMAFWSLAPGLRSNTVPIWPGADFTDLMTAHLPAAAYIQRAVELYGWLPGWNPTILSGMPILPDPLSSIVYPPHWPLFLLPTPAGATLLAGLHLVFGSLGLVLYLRRRDLSTAGVTIAALAFSGMPKLIGHFALGHLTTVYAVSWTPWLLLCCDSVIGTDGDREPSKRWAAAAGAVWAVISLADIRWAVIAGMIGLAYLAYRIGLNRPRSWSALGRCALHGGLAALLIPAVQLLPLWHWWQASSRSALTFAERTEFSLPPVQLLGLVIPPWSAWPEWITYAGVSILILALVALLDWSHESRFWWAIVIASVVVSLGDQLPVAGRLLFSVPGLSGLRVPPRFLLAAGIGFAALAAFGADILEQRRTASVRPVRRISAAALAVGLAAGSLVLLPGAASALSDSLASGLTLLAAAAAAAGILLLIGSITDGSRTRWLAWGWVALIIFELGSFNRSLIESRRLDRSPEILDMLADQSPGSRYRVFSPSLSVAPYQAARAGLELADGVHPLIYEPYWAHMAAATGYDPQGYSVTVPPHPGGIPEEPWGADPDPVLLGRLNVLYMVSAYEVSAEGWSRLADSPATGEFLYRNEEWRPRAWVETPEGGSDADVSWAPGRILIRARGPGRLVVSELAVPGWKITVDDQPVSSAADAAPLTAVTLTQGEHLVEMSYRTPGGVLGLAATLVGLLFLGWTWWRS